MTYGDVTVVSTVEGINADELKGLVQLPTKAIPTAPRKSRSRSKRFPIGRCCRLSVRSRHAARQPRPATTRSASNIWSTRASAPMSSVSRSAATRRTRDYVIRREFDISEGDAFNQQMITRAKRRLEALGYFSVSQYYDRAGQFCRTASSLLSTCRSADRFVRYRRRLCCRRRRPAAGSLDRRKELPRSRPVHPRCGRWRSGRLAHLQHLFTEPYFLGYRLAAGFDIFTADVEQRLLRLRRNQRFVLRVTAPITGRSGNDVPLQLQADEVRFQRKQLHDLSATYQNLVDESPWTQLFHFADADLQHAGRHRSCRVRVSTPPPRRKSPASVATRSIYKLYGKARYYHLLADDADIIGSLSARPVMSVGFGDHLNVFDQFTLTQCRYSRLRKQGYRSAHRRNPDDPLGGTTYFTASAEATFPMPGFPRDFNLRGAVFADAGTLFGNDVELLGSPIPKKATVPLCVRRSVSV